MNKSYIQNILCALCFLFSLQAKAVGIIADAGGPYSGNEGSPIALVSSTTLVGGAILDSVEWDFGDGNNSFSPIPTHTYVDNGTYVVTFLATTTSGESDSDVTTSTINNVAPEVDPISNSFIKAGELLELMVTFSDPANNHDAPFFYEIDWGDGSPLTTGTVGMVTPISANHIYTGSAGADFVGNVRITDKDSGVGESIFHIDIIEANVTEFGIVDAASAQDTGPDRDGVYDAALSGPNGPVGDNGFSEIRTALEFDISEIVAGSTIESARLILNHTSTDPERNVELLGYLGDGSISLAEFADSAMDDLIGDMNIGLSPTVVEFDVTVFIQNLLNNGGNYAGFKLREGSTSGSLTMIFVLGGEFTQPVLEISYIPGTPGDQLVALINNVNGLNLSTGLSRSLNGKLGRVLVALEDSIDQNNDSAIWRLYVFINSVERQRGYEISDDDADALIAAAQAIIDSLSE